MERRGMYKGLWKGCRLVVGRGEFHNFLSKVGNQLSWLKTYVTPGKVSRSDLDWLTAGDLRNKAKAAIDFQVLYAIDEGYLLSHPMMMMVMVMMIMVMMIMTINDNINNNNDNNDNNNKTIIIIIITIIIIVIIIVIMIIVIIMIAKFHAHYLFSALRYTAHHF